MGPGGACRQILLELFEGKIKMGPQSYWIARSLECHCYATVFSVFRGWNALQIGFSLQFSRTGLCFERSFSFFSILVFFIRTKFIRKWSSNRQNLKRIVRKSRGSNSKIKCFLGQKSVFRRCCIQYVKDRIEIQV